MDKIISYHEDRIKKLHANSDYQKVMKDMSDLNQWQTLLLNTNPADKRVYLLDTLLEILLQYKYDLETTILKDSPIPELDQFIAEMHEKYAPE